MKRKNNKFLAISSLISLLILSSIFGAYLIIYFKTSETKKCIEFANASIVNIESSNKIIICYNNNGYKSCQTFLVEKFKNCDLNIGDSVSKKCEYDFISIHKNNCEIIIR
jgi:hypothetical protein